MLNPAGISKVSVTGSRAAWTDNTTGERSSVSLPQAMPCTVDALAICLHGELVIESKRTSRDIVKIAHMTADYTTIRNFR